MTSDIGKDFVGAVNKLLELVVLSFKHLLLKYDYLGCALSGFLSYTLYKLKLACILQFEDPSLSSAKLTTVVHH